MDAVSTWWPICLLWPVSGPLDHPVRRWPHLDAANWSSDLLSVWSCLLLVEFLNQLWRQKLVITGCRRMSLKCLGSLTVVLAVLIILVQVKHWNFLKNKISCKIVFFFRFCKLAVTLAEADRYRRVSSSWTFRIWSVRDFGAGLSSCRPEYSPSSTSKFLTNWFNWKSWLHFIKMWIRRLWFN